MKVPAPLPEPSCCRGTCHRAVTSVAAVFVGIVAVLMIAGELRQPVDEPWRSPALVAARQRLQQEPGNTDLEKAVRLLDLAARNAYFRTLERQRVGGWMIMAGAVVLILSASRRGSLSPPVALQHLTTLDRDREATVVSTRRTLSAVGLTLATVLAALGLLSRRQVPEAVAALNAPIVGEATPNAASPTWPDAAERAANWPRFLGAETRSPASIGSPAIRWDVKTGAGVVWKSAVRLPGFSSPVVWKDRVFVTGGDKAQRRVFCLDARNGSNVWERGLTPAGTPDLELEPPDQSGAAASSPATDGRRVFAIFATGEIGALDFNGALLWNRRVDLSANPFGHASSLVTWHGLLFVQVDVGQEEEGHSELLALDTATGEIRWRMKRPVGSSWATPFLMETGGVPQLLVAGDPLLISYNPETGTERWRARVLGGELAPSPVAAAGLIIAANPGHMLTALRSDGTGDVTATHVAWKTGDDVPDVPSPVVSGELLFTANTAGGVVCRELKTGSPLWNHELDAPFQASPLAVGGYLYLIGQQGQVAVLEAGREFRQVAAFDMGEEVFASAASAGGRLFVRTLQNVYCVGPNAEGPGP